MAEDGSHDRLLLDDSSLPSLRPLCNNNSSEELRKVDSYKMPVSSLKEWKGADQCKDIPSMDSVQCAEVPSMDSVQCSEVPSMDSVQCAEVPSMDSVQCAEVPSLDSVQCAEVPSVEAVKSAILPCSAQEDVPHSGGVKGGGKITSRRSDSAFLDPLLHCGGEGDSDSDLSPDTHPTFDQSKKGPRFYRDQSAAESGSGHSDPSVEELGFEFVSDHYAGEVGLSGGALGEDGEGVEGVCSADVVGELSDVGRYSYACLVACTLYTLYDYSVHHR